MLKGNPLRRNENSDGSFLFPVSFSDNGRNSAKSTTATFATAGSYTFTVTIRDAEGLLATSSVDVDVAQSPTSLTVSPSSVIMGKGESRRFTATVFDQFDALVSSQPAVDWSASGGGSVAPDGTFTAASVGGPYTIAASSGSLSRDSIVSITGEVLSHWRAAHFNSEEIGAGMADDLADRMATARSISSNTRSERIRAPPHPSRSRRSTPPAVSRSR